MGDGWRKHISDAWLKYKSSEQPQVLTKIKEAQRREKIRKEKIQQKKEEITKQKEEKARQALSFEKRKGEIEVDLKQLRDELPSPQMKTGGWGNRQIPIRKQIKTVLRWLKAVRTEDKLQICQSQYPDVKSEWQDFMQKYRAWEKKQREEEKQKEQANQALKVRKDKLAEPFQDLRKRFDRFRLKEEKPIVKKAKKLADTIVKRIQGAEDLEQLKEMEIFPSLQQPLDRAKGAKKIEIPLSTRREELEEKLNLLEERRTLIQEVQNCRERLDKLDRQEEKDEVREKKQALKDLLSKIYQTESKMDLITVQSDVTTCNQKVNSLIVNFEERRAEQKTREEDREQARKEQIQIQKQINKLQKEKERIKEQLNKNIFQKKDLSSQERAIFETLEGYRQRKTAPINDLTSFFEKLGLIKKVYFWDKIQTGPNKGRTIQDAFWKSYPEKFGKYLPLEYYLAVDGQVYPLDYFKNWDQAKFFIQIRIGQLRDKAVNERKKELSGQWYALDKKQQSLKPPLYYIRTNRRLVQARNYLGEKEDQRLHFKFEDGTVWMLPKGREWTVYTKIDYGGGFLSFISKKGSTIVGQTNEGTREISKDQIFCYIYEYKGSEPFKKE